MIRPITSQGVGCIDELVACGAADLGARAIQGGAAVCVQAVGRVAVVVDRAHLPPQAQKSRWCGLVRAAR